MKKYILLPILIVLILVFTGCRPSEATVLPASPEVPHISPEVPPTYTLIPSTSTSVPPTLTVIPPTSAPITPTNPPDIITKGDIEVGSLNRTYLYHVPANLPPNAPLLLVFHGYTFSANNLRYSTRLQFESLADQNGFIVVYPSGIETSWNDCRKLLPAPAREQNVDDVDFVRTLIAKFKVDFDIDTSRVFAAGYSNGGMLAYRLALELPGEINAIAVVSAMLPVEEDNICHASGNPIPVFIMNGTEDPFLPYDGGFDRYFGNAMSPFLSTQATAEYFVKLNGLSNPPKVTRLPHLSASDPTTVDRVVWFEAGKPEVVLLKINGGGHVIPLKYSSWREEFGVVAGDIEGPVEIWDFFSRQPSLK